MYGLTSTLADKSIYDFLSEEQLSRAPVVDINKDIVFIPAIGKENMELYYVLDGIVEVVSNSYNGRSFLVDTVGPGEFMGRFSNMRKKNFYADIKTKTPCKLLNLSKIKNEILNDERFIIFFYFKTSNRLYEMYKISMMRRLFSYEEILAYYLLQVADEAGFITDTEKNICFETSISERQYYYLMKSFRDRKIIDQNKKKIRILDIASLEVIALNIVNFMGNSI